MKIALWGLAFKPDTDDIREAPALYMIEELLKEGAIISAFDPEAMENVKARYNSENLSFASSQYEAIEDADVLLIATEWNTFRNPDFNTLKKAMKTPLILDGRNLYDQKDMKDKGFVYVSIGRS